MEEHALTSLQVAMTGLANLQNSLNPPEQELTSVSDVNDVRAKAAQWSTANDRRIVTDSPLVNAIRAELLSGKPQLPARSWEPEQQ
jgi:hypothetical protein